MPLCFTLSASRIPTKYGTVVRQTSCPCSGIKVCLYLRSGKLHPLYYIYIFIEYIFLFRYASDLTPDQKDALLDVVRATPHAQIGPEIRRELVNSVVRGAPRMLEDQDVQMS
jgi:hypothetical protein